jgi:hypothetical protein
MYIKESANMLYDISTGDSPTALLQELFKKTSAVHDNNTRVAKKNNFYIKYSCIELQKCSFSRLGVEIWNSIVRAFAQKVKRYLNTKCARPSLQFLQLRITMLMCP